MPLCGGLMIGVERSEPYTPPFETVNVPPLSSSRWSLLSRARAPKSAITSRSGKLGARRRGSPAPRVPSSADRDPDVV